MPGSSGLPALELTSVHRPTSHTQLPSQTPLSPSQSHTSQTKPPTSESKPQPKPTEKQQHSSDEDSGCSSRNSWDVVRQDVSSRPGRDESPPSAVAAATAGGKEEDNIANTRPATVTSPVPTAVASGADPLSRVIPGSDSGGSLSRQDGGSGSLDLRSKVVMSGRSGSGSFGARVGSPTQQLTRGESGLMAALEENGFSSAGGPDLDLDDLVRDSDSVTDQLGAFHYVKVCAVGTCVSVAGY